MQETHAWLVQALNTSSEKIVLRPINPKLRVRSCESGWQWRLYAEQLTVQATCQRPRTLFLIKWERSEVDQGSTKTLTAKTGSKVARVSDPKPPIPATRTSVAPLPTSQAPAVEQKKALIVTQTLARGTHLRADMLGWVDVPTAQWRPHHLDHIQVAQGAELTRDMQPGQILAKHDIRPSVMVKKGQWVTYLISSPTSNTSNGASFQITIKLQALQDGRLGETINLKNPDSGRILNGVITGLNAAQSP